MTVKIDIPRDYGYTTPFPQGDLKQQIISNKCNDTPLQEPCISVSQREFYNLVNNIETIQKQVQELQQFKQEHCSIFAEVSLLSKVSRWILIGFSVLYVVMGISIFFYFLFGHFEKNNVSYWVNWVIGFIGVGGCCTFARFVWNTFTFERRLKNLETKMNANS